MTRTDRIFCTAPGCVEPAEGAVLFAYVRERRHYLCAEHIRPIRLALLHILGPDQLAGRPAPAPAAASPA